MLFTRIVNENVLMGVKIKRNCDNTQHTVIPSHGNVAGCVCTYVQTHSSALQLKLSWEHFQNIAGQVDCFKTWWLSLIRWGNSIKDLTHEGTALWLLLFLPNILSAAYLAIILSLRNKGASHYISRKNADTLWPYLISTPKYQTEQSFTNRLFYHTRHFDVWGLAVISLGIRIHRSFITHIQEFFKIKEDQNMTVIGGKMPPFFFQVSLK